MTRLPQVGGDSNDWGGILNDFLGVSHNIDGTIKSAAVPVGSVNGQTGNITLTAGGIGAYSTSQVDSFLRATDAIIIYNTETSSYPVRSSVTADSSRPVRWRGPVAPTIGGSYAIDGLDVWEMTS